MPVFTPHDFVPYVTYCDDPVGDLPVGERFFNYSAASDVGSQPERTPLDRQLVFHFYHDGVGTHILLNPPLPSCITSILTGYLAGLIPTEANCRDVMINLAVRVAKDALEEALPSDRIVYVDIRPSREGYHYDAWAPADERAVEMLARKRVSSVDCLETCAICWEEFEIGQEELAMPCSHVFHEDCIKGWLKRSHCCPLCRFEVPVDTRWDRWVKKIRVSG